MSNAKRRHRRRRRQMFLRHRSWVTRLYALARREKWLDLDAFKGELWSDLHPEQRAEILFRCFISKSGKDITSETY